MTVFLAWADFALDVNTPGPWESMHRVSDDLVLIDSAATLSRVYHELKWSLPPGSALFVASLTTRPKLARMASGSLSWLRARLP